MISDQQMWAVESRWVVDTEDDQPTFIPFVEAAPRLAAVPRLRVVARDKWAHVPDCSCDPPSGPPIKAYVPPPSCGTAIELSHLICGVTKTIRIGNPTRPNQRVGNKLN